MDAKSRIPLAAMLGELRSELLQARGAGEGSALRFEIEDIEIELQTAVTQQDEGGVGVKFWVLDASAKLEDAEVKTQKVKLRLKVASDEVGRPLPISSRPTGRPR